MTELVVTNEQIEKFLLEIYSRNYAQPEGWFSLNQIGIAAGLLMPQAKHCLRVLEGRNQIEVRRPPTRTMRSATDEGDEWEIRLAPAGHEEVIRLRAPDLGRLDIVDQVRIAARRNPLIAWIIIVIVSATVLLTLFNQVIQGLKNLGILK